jgi:hypothetical protein
MNDLESVTDLPSGFGLDFFSTARSRRIDFVLSVSAIDVNDVGVLFHARLSSAKFGRLDGPEAPWSVCSFGGNIPPVSAIVFFRSYALVCGVGGLLFGLTLVTMLGLRDRRSEYCELP